METEKERRKIVYNCVLGKYEVLKLATDKLNLCWFEEGEKKTIHGLDELLKREEFQFEMSDDIREIVEMYRIDREERKRKYSPNN